MTERQLRRRVERRHATHFWGRKYWITPRLCDRSFGDGKQLIYLASLDHRPNYYVVRVDSAWNIKGGDFDDHHDDVWEALVAQFGESWTEGCEHGNRKHPREFPAVPSDMCGSFWGVIPRSEIAW